MLINYANNHVGFFWQDNLNKNGFKVVGKITGTTKVISSLVHGLPSAGELQAVVNLRAVSFGKYPNWVALEGLSKFA
jgi:hypothetical protein